MKRTIGILETGPANYLSILNAIKKIGYKCLIVKDKSISEKKLSHLILPGVGSFDSVMQFLKKKKKINFIKDFVKSKKPVLGICVGYQILFEKSTEGKLNGLKIFRGKFEHLKNLTDITPNIGWHKVQGNKKMFKCLNYQKDEYFYFSHSYYLRSYDKKYLGGSINIKKKIPVVIIKDNVFGFQFHPEKSCQQGIKLLKEFCQK